MKYKEKSLDLKSEFLLLMDTFPKRRKVKQLKEDFNNPGDFFSSSVLRLILDVRDFSCKDFRSFNFYAFKAVLGRNSLYCP